MPTRTAEAVWSGNITEGKGTIKTQSGVLAGVAYDWRSRSAEGPNTNPDAVSPTNSSPTCAESTAPAK